MKLTEDQLVLLQETLNDRLQYKETYDEVYDHVLTALEDVNDNIPLGEAVNTIMLNDFGGFKGLKTIERKRKWMIARQMMGKQLCYFTDNFKLPLLPLTVIIYAFVYYCILDLKFIPLAWVILFVAALIPNVFGVMRFFKIGYYTENKKKSIKNFPFKIISLLPYYILFISNAVFSPKYHFYSWFNIPPLILTFIFTGYIIYTISFFRLYKSELIKPVIK